MMGGEPIEVASADVAQVPLYDSAKCTKKKHLEKFFKDVLGVILGSKICHRIPMQRRKMRLLLVKE